MGYRVIFIESESRLSVKLDNLIVNKGEGDIWIPLSDISMVVIDNLHITLTARMLSLFAENNIGVIISDGTHTPIGYYCSYDNHSRVAKVLGYQMAITSQRSDELWKLLVSEKINNQRKCLEKLEKNESVVNKLKEYAQSIESGDMTNREAHAAKVYFNTIMGESFSRGNEEILLNSGLDYGYAVIRAYIARVCVGYGLNTQMGIHHRNEYNRFNLVDDLIEPIRPMVDYYSYTLLKDEEYFKAEHRHKLVNVLNHKICYKNKNMFICNMIEEYVEEYAAYLSGRREKIEFPDFSGYQVMENEI